MYQVQEYLNLKKAKDAQVHESLGLSSFLDLFGIAARLVSNITRQKEYTPAEAIKVVERKIKVLQKLERVCKQGKIKPSQCEILRKEVVDLDTSP